MRSDWICFYPFLTSVWLSTNKKIIIPWAGRACSDEQRRWKQRAVNRRVRSGLRRRPCVRPSTSGGCQWKAARLGNRRCLWLTSPGPSHRAHPPPTETYTLFMRKSVPRLFPLENPCHNCFGNEVTLKKREFLPNSVPLWRRIRLWKESPLNQDEIPTRLNWLSATVHNLRWNRCRGFRGSACCQWLRFFRYLRCCFVYLWYP